MRFAKLRDDQIAIATLRDEPARHDVSTARIVLIEEQVLDEARRPRNWQVRHLELVEPRLIGPQLARLQYLFMRRRFEMPPGDALVDPGAAARSGKRPRFELAE